MMKWILVLISLLTMNLATSAYGRPSITLAYEDKPNYPYYTGFGQTPPPSLPGASIELLALLDETLNLEIKFERYSWDQCKQMLKAGKVDGIFNASFRPERQKIGVYPMSNGVPIAAKRIDTISYVLYKRKGDGLSWDSENKQIIGLTGNIGAPKGYSIVKDLNSWGIPVITSRDSLRDLRSLLKSELGAVAALERAGEFYVNNNQGWSEKIEKVDPPLITKPYYLMLSHQFHKSNPELSLAIWDKIELLRERHLESILFRYFK